MMNTTTKWHRTTDGTYWANVSSYRIRIHKDKGVGGYDWVLTIHETETVAGVAVATGTTQHGDEFKTLAQAKAAGAEWVAAK